MTPVDPGAYSQAALGVGNTAAWRKLLVAEHKILLKSHHDYLGIEDAGRDSSCMQWAMTHSCHSKSNTLV
jgi:hypothetical protein